MLVKVGAAGLGLSGLQHCGAVWICPVCSSVVWSERSLEIGMVAAAHIGAGGQIAFLSLTTRHKAGDRLEGLMGFLKAGWLGLFDGRGGMELRESLGLLGHIRVTEVNYGENGWHPHFHVALFVGSEVTQEGLERLLDKGFKRWQKAVCKAGGRVPERQCQDVRLFGAGDAAELAEYMSKTLIDGGRSGRPESDGRVRPTTAATSAATVGERLGRELTQGQRKRARKFYGTVPARALLTMAREDGDADALDLWREYELATKGARTISWSRGLRDLYGLEEERSDQDIVDDERGGVAVMRLTEMGLARIIGWPELVPGMQWAYKDDGYVGLKNFMDTNRIEYEEISDATDEL